MIQELLSLWKQYKELCAVNWQKEVDRAKEINVKKLENNEEGFEFPQKTEINTPSFESFMEWLHYEKGNK